MNQGYIWGNAAQNAHEAPLVKKEGAAPKRGPKVSNTFTRDVLSIIFMENGMCGRMALDNDIYTSVRILLC